VQAGPPLPVLKFKAASWRLKSKGNRPPDRMVNIRIYLVIATKIEVMKVTTFIILQSYFSLR
jgi:hypothetical protein